MFGIQSFVIKIIAVVLGIIVAGFVIVGVATMSGCVPENAAMIQRNDSEAHDDSITYSGAPGVVDPVELVAAKTAQKTAVIRAEKEPWRIIAYTVGIPVGVGLICGIILAWLYIRAYLAESPWDGTRKRKDVIDA